MKEQFIDTWALCINLSIYLFEGLHRGMGWAASWRLIVYSLDVIVSIVCTVLE
jgi:hypothetical protein